MMKTMMMIDDDMMMMTDDKISTAPYGCNISGTDMVVAKFRIIL